MTAQAETPVSIRREGLTSQEVVAALETYGANVLPVGRPPSFLKVLLMQFLSPLIYILMVAAVVSAFVSEITDALFIAVVLAINGIIGAVQEYSAGQSASALRALEEPRATVVRDGIRQVIDATGLVPGDRVLLESGQRVPADILLDASEHLQCDEATHTGESRPVYKSTDDPVFAGTIVARGRGEGLVTATGSRTELGRIADAIRERTTAKPPLMIRMEEFTRRIAVAVGVAILFLFAVGWWRAMPVGDLFTMSIGLAVSAIPEALPIAISVALAIGMRRMARVNVIVRNLPAVESLGSCTMIATDKTGTLTLNELTVTDIRLPDDSHWVLEAGSHPLSGGIKSRDGGKDGPNAAVRRLLGVGSLPNEAEISVDGAETWRPVGDTVDVALLAAAHKAGISRSILLERFPLERRIPYEPEQKYAASFHQVEDRMQAFVKGAPELLLSMCKTMETTEGAVPIDRIHVHRQIKEMAREGLRVLAFAAGEIGVSGDGEYGGHLLIDLNFLGLVGMQDPIRPEVPAALDACRQAGIGVAVITGDDPTTASVIARQAGMRFEEADVVTGDEIADAVAAGESVLDGITRHGRIFARVKPDQKLAIIRSLARNGHYVAVTGDGVNDAPALRHAHVGVAMGHGGTEVAKESADIILTDDNFASIVAGIREGRVAYNNIRKVIFMQISTGAAEVLLFLLAMVLGAPMPMTAVQLLWLNLVTNGVQDVALVTEPAEGDELRSPVRRPGEPIFDRLMLRRIVLATLVMGGGGFALFYWATTSGLSHFAASNLLLLLFVLFENVQCINSRSERRSVFRQSHFSNPFLLLGVLGSQALHIGAMYVPGVNDLLEIAPISLEQWLLLLVATAPLLAVSEVDKWLLRRQESMKRGNDDSKAQ
ncbi:HAD-IC family P-type ATPase [Ciceribacter sp. RN22]|uniref:cation-translocating P-type ATPase n=1 Tax=Ciceribacter sp. RN22 TaxID=2954932 RepID=UPI0020938DAA|nr:HAD-IC family P-type ATPase [Ciceribacter sp. RN22]MCO6178225.1 HAD-IC family P-type ATPase [Ciceribacter sp. RN22]